LSRTVRVLAVLIVALLSFSVIPSIALGAPTVENAAVAAAAPATEVKIGWLSEVVMWNPMNIEMVEDYVVCYLMFGTLYTYDQDWGGPVNDLATGYTQVVNGDGTMTTTITITQNAYFRNAADPTDTTHPLTAYDVEFTLEQVILHPGGAWDFYLASVTDITVIDNWNFVITTSYPKATLIDDLSGIPIIPQYMWESMLKPDKFLTSKTPAWLIGSGPFYFDDMSAGAWVRFTNAPNYYGAADYPGVREVQYVQSILFTTYTTASAMVISMNSGTEDCIVLAGEPNLYLNSLGVGAAVPIKKYAVQEPGICDVAINAIPIVNRTPTYGQGNPILLDPIVREAISMTLNRDAIINDIMQGLATPADSVIQPNYWHTTPTPARVYDPAAARTLLEANGYEDTDPADGVLECTATAYPVEQGWADAGDPLFFEIHAPNTDPSWGSVAQNWVTWGALAGIEFDASILSETVMINNDWYKAQYDIWVWHWGWGPEPLSTMSCWLWEEMAPGGDNCQMPMGPTPGDYDAVYREAQRTLDKADRKVLVDLLQQWVHDSDCETPPYYDLGLYGLTEQRWLGWGNWTQHVGRAAPASDLIWLWFDLYPNTANQVPLFDQELDPYYAPIAGSLATFAVTVHDADGDPLYVNWTWGDGSPVQQNVLSTGTTNPTPVSRSHTYTTVGEYNLEVTLYDGVHGHQTMTNATINVMPEPNDPPYFTSAVTHTPASPVYIGESVTWSVSAADHESGGATGYGLLFTWDWGDGMFDVNLHQPITNDVAVTDTTSYAWDSAGTYNVQVYIYDGFNDPTHNVSSAPITYIVIANEAPGFVAAADVDTTEDVLTTLSATAMDVDPDPLRFTWDFGNGSKSVTNHAADPGVDITSSVTHTWTAAGNYLVTVWVDDLTGDPFHNVSTTLVAHVAAPPNNAPSAPLLSADPPAPVYAGTDVTFDASAIDSDADALRFTIDYDDGEWAVLESAGGVTTRQSVQFVHAYAAAGTYTVFVYIDDLTGQVGHNISTSMSYEVIENTAPAVPDISPITGNEGVSTQCVSTSSDPDADALRFTWDFGNSTYMVTDHTGVVGDVVSEVWFTWATAGNYLVTVWVDDMMGHNESASIVAVIQAAGNLPPSGALLSVSPASGTAYPADDITFTASASDADGDVLNFYIEYGDGASDVDVGAGGTSAQQVVFTHAYAAAGSYSITVWIDDMTGDPSHNVSRNIPAYVIRADQAPSVPNIAAISGQEDVSIACIATSSDADAGTLRFTWMWGDGAETVTNHVHAAGATVTSAVSHTWAAAGTYTVTVWVDDLTGLAGHNVSGTEDAVISATPNVGPNTPSLSASTAAPLVDEVVTFTTQSADADGDALTFYIEYGDGAVAVDTGAGGAGTQQVQFTHAYTVADTYVVTVWADDGVAGAGHNKSASINVVVSEPTNSAPVVLLPSSFSANYNVTKAFLPTSITDPDDDPMTVSWNWGDGSAWTMGDAGADYSASHKYSVIGSRTITVYADDGQGHNVSDTAPVTITETNQKAQTISVVLNPSRTTFWVNTTVNFTVTLYDYEGDVATLTVDWGDGSTPSSQTVDLAANVNQEVTLTHMFTAASAVPYTVVATVDDNQDHSNPTLDTAEVDVNVSVWTPPSEEDGGGGIDTMTLALIGIVIVVVVILAALLLMKRKKGAEGGESGGMEGGVAPPE